MSATSTTALTTSPLTIDHVFSQSARVIKFKDVLLLVSSALRATAAVVFSIRYTGEWTERLEFGRSAQRIDYGCCDECKSTNFGLYLKLLVVVYAILTMFVSYKTLGYSDVDVDPKDDILNIWKLGFTNGISKEMRFRRVYFVQKLALLTGQFTLLAPYTAISSGCTEMTLKSMSLAPALLSFSVFFVTLIVIRFLPGLITKPHLKFASELITNIAYLVCVIFCFIAMGMFISTVGMRFILPSFHIIETGVMGLLGLLAVLGELIR
jgi:hypothetical protein